MVTAGKRLLQETAAGVETVIIKYTGTALAFFGQSGGPSHNNHHLAPVRIACYGEHTV